MHIIEIDKWHAAALAAPPSAPPSTIASLGRSCTWFVFVCAPNGPSLSASAQARSSLWGPSPGADVLQYRHRHRHRVAGIGTGTGWPVSAPASRYAGRGRRARRTPLSAIGIALKYMYPNCRRCQFPHLHVTAVTTRLMYAELKRSSETVRRLQWGPWAPSTYHLRAAERKVCEAHSSTRPSARTAPARTQSGLAPLSRSSWSST